MGWAKYLEDNIEIMSERQFLMENHRQEIANKIVCNSELIPLPNIALKAINERGGVDFTCEEKKYEDRYIICKDCGKKFLFSAQAQKHFATKGWASQKRCKKCRNFRNTRYLMCSSF